MLVIDSSVAVAASHRPWEYRELHARELVAPAFLTVESSSVLHASAWRKEISTPHARRMLDRLLSAPIALHTPTGLTRAAWNLADRLGWAKTYDAHFVALAQLLHCPLVTLDDRLLRGIARLGIGVRPQDL